MHVKTAHVCAADALQEESGDLSLSVKLCLSNTHLMLRLHMTENKYKIDTALSYIST